VKHAPPAVFHYGLITKICPKIPYALFPGGAVKYKPRFVFVVVKSKNIWLPVITRARKYNHKPSMLRGKYSSYN
jgi:hypothetical protein